MEIVDNKVGVPMAHYRSVFAAKNPEEMAQHSHIPYADGRFTFQLLSRPVELRWPEMDAVYTDDGSATASNVQILLARLVMEGSITHAGGKLLAYTDMPWGNVYAQQFRGRCILRLAGTYGNAIEAFRTACEKVGGVAANSGDVSYDMPFLDGLTVRLILWEGDDEFQPQAQILFSDNFADAFQAEDNAVVGDILLNALKGRW